MSGYGHAEIALKRAEAYLEGQRAFALGHPMNKNPHGTGSETLLDGEGRSWVRGWQAAQEESWRGANQS